MFVRANFVDSYSQGMRDRSMRSGTELAWEIKLTDWSMARNLSKRSSGVQRPRDICTRLKRYLYSAKCSWIITLYCVISLANFRLLFNLQLIRSSSARGSSTSILSRWYLQILKENGSLGVVFYMEA